MPTALLKFLELAVGGAELLTVVPGKKGVSLISANNGSTASVQTAITIAGADAPFSIDTKSFTDAIKGREATYTFNGHDLVLKAGKFEATIATSGSPSIPEFSQSEDKGIDLHLSEDHRVFLAQALSATKIEKTFSALADLLVYVRATDKEVLISTFENHQVAYIRAKNKVGFPACDMVMPLSAAAKVSSMPGAFRLKLSDSSLDLTGKTARVQIPLSVETINAIPREAVLDLIKQTFKEQEATTVIPKAQLVTFIENSRSVSVVGSEVSIAPAGKAGVLLTVTSPKGTVKEKFPGVCENRISMDLRFLSAMLAKSGETLSISNMGAFVLLKSAGVSYIAAYNASTASDSD